MPADQAVRRLIALAAIRFYRRFLSRYTPHCVQKPICSTYALHAVREHGSRVGLEMTLRRIHACGKETPDAQVP